MPRSRMPEIVYLTIGIKKDGTMTARHIKVIATDGAYSGNGFLMMRIGLVEAAGLYRCPNVRLEGKCVYTNTVPSGAVRVFGTAQVTFATESMMDKIAEKLNIDPIDLRLKNAIKGGDVTMFGQKIGSCGLEECMEKVARHTNWKEKRANKQPNRGVGMACAMHCSDARKGLGFTGSTAYVKVLSDGRIRVISGEYEWGQGSHTILSQIVAEELGVPLETVEFPSEVDTEVHPFTLGPYGGGPVTLRAGHAVRLAARDAKRQLFTLAAEMLRVSSEKLEMKDQKLLVSRAPEKVVSIAEAASYGRYSPSGAEVIGKGVYNANTEDLDSETLHGNFSSAYSFVAQVAEVEVDPETGRVKLLDFTNAVDLGKAINPMSAEGVSQGGVAEEIGAALMEEIMYDEGTVMNPNFIDYKVPTALDMPSIKAFLVETNDPNGPYGAKACGMTSNMPATAAIANAIYNAVGVRIKDLPITPMKVLKALENKGGDNDRET